MGMGIAFRPLMERTERKSVKELVEAEGGRIVSDEGLHGKDLERLIASIDLDLFGKIDTNGYELQSILNKYGVLKVENETKIIHQYYIDNIKVDVVNYPFEWISPMVEEDGVRLASPTDIAAMKVNAIEGRGTKKDFIDMYMLLQHYSLEEIIAFYQQKYPNYSTFRALRSLTYFDDAEEQFMPRMFIGDTWEEIKQFIINKVKTIKL